MIPEPVAPPEKLPLALQWLLVAAGGLIIANLYYAQPLTGVVGRALGMSKGAVGLLQTLPLMGYCLGLLVIVPLGDLLENRRLVMVLVGLETLCLLGVSFACGPASYFAAAFLVGLSASAVQIIVPYATHLAPSNVSGRVVERVVSGVMLGIMLARPAASLVADVWSWRAIFRISAVLMAALFVGLRAALPARRPPAGLRYGALLLSLGRIFVGTEILRRRAFYHACLFGAFSVFWTAAPLWLSSSRFGLTQRGIAWVALAGVAGAIAPPFAGRIADRGLSRPFTAVAMVVAIGAVLLSTLARDGSLVGVAPIVAAAIVLDFAVSANLVFGQRAIYALDAKQRSRINGLFMATFFAGGALGAAASGWAYARFGWPGVTALGVGLPFMGLGYLMTERKPAGAVSGTRR